MIHDHIVEDYCEKVLLFFLYQVHMGVKGIVKDENGIPVNEASIKVEQFDGEKYNLIEHDVETSALFEIRNFFKKLFLINLI